jgi:hypothetical protein
MKQISALFLMLLYVLPTFGNTLSMHYCGGKLASVSFGYSVSKKCGCDVNSTKEGCCDDKSYQLNTLDKQYKSPQFQILSDNKTPLIAPVYPSFILAFNCIDLSSFSPEDHHPPNKNQIPLFVLNQVFRI